MATVAARRRALVGLLVEVRPLMEGKETPVALRFLAQAAVGLAEGNQQSLCISLAAAGHSLALHL